MTYKTVNKYVSWKHWRLFPRIFRRLLDDKEKAGIQRIIEFEIMYAVLKKKTVRSVSHRGYEEFGKVNVNI